MKYTYGSVMSLFGFRLWDRMADPNHSLGAILSIDTSKPLTQAGSEIWNKKWHNNQSPDEICMLNIVKSWELTNFGWDFPISVLAGMDIMDGAPERY